MSKYTDLQNSFTQHLQDRFPDHWGKGAEKIKSHEGSGLGNKVISVTCGALAGAAVEAVCLLIPVVGETAGPVLAAAVGTIVAESVGKKLSQRQESARGKLSPGQDTLALRS